MGIQHWGVDVRVNHKLALTIESNCLSGRELSTEDEEAIRTAAQHLLAFVGQKPSEQSPSPVPSIDLALIRWSVVHHQWHELSGGIPSLSGFLAGWFCRVCEARPPVIVGRFRDSFQCGWREAHEQIVILSRQNSVE